MQGFIQIIQATALFFDITKVLFLTLLISKMKINVGQDLAWKSNILAPIFKLTMVCRLVASPPPDSKKKLLRPKHTYCTVHIDKERSIKLAVCKN